MSLREPAWRVTARELEASLEEEKGTGERATSYLLSPFGARMSRVLVAGTLSPAEPIGRDQNQPFWRSRLADPTGAVAITAGSFQPRAMAQLRAVPTPRPAIVVGRTHLYRGRDGVGYVSVRAEGIRAVAEGEERSVLADVARQTLDRLDLVERLEKEPSVSDHVLAEDGIPSVWVRAARASLVRYPQVDRAAFRREMTAVVRAVGGGLGPVGASVAPPPEVRVSRAPSPRPPAPAPTAAERAEESLFLDLLDEVADGSVDGYADWKALLERTTARGLVAERAEAVLNRLEEDGVIEEPIVGKLRRS